MAVLAIGLALLAVVQLAGGAWWLIAEGDTGVLPFTPVIVLFEGLMAWAAWRRTTWTKHPVVPGHWRDPNRVLSQREVALTRSMATAFPLLALLGWAVGWWGWTLLPFLVASTALSVWVMPEHHRRQLLDH
jgi:hypothetical protein